MAVQWGEGHIIARSFWAWRTGCYFNLPRLSADWPLKMQCEWTSWWRWWSVTTVSWVFVTIGSHIQYYLHILTSIVVWGHYIRWVVILKMGSFTQSLSTLFSRGSMSRSPAASEHRTDVSFLHLCQFSVHHIHRADSWWLYGQPEVNWLVSVYINLPPIYHV